MGAPMILPVKESGLGFVISAVKKVLKPIFKYYIGFGFGL
jgi:hypothetical protein